MDNLIYYVFIALAFLAGYLITAQYYVKKISDWRIKCIELEHDLANKEERKPRHIDDI